MTPTEPEMCLETGRLLTEWFEYPEVPDDKLEAMAMKALGIDHNPRAATFGNFTAEERDITRRINQFIMARKSRKWRNGMTQQEVHWRMNEATKMVSPDNYKFLADDVRERTGLELNPLWMMECLVRSGVLSPKEQVAALTNLASYTHSKAATLSHNVTTTMKPEDWLLELAKEEYQQIEYVQPMQPRERGMGERFVKNRAQKEDQHVAVVNYKEAELAALKAELEGELEDWE